MLHSLVRSPNARGAALAPVPGRADISRRRVLSAAFALGSALVTRGGYAVADAFSADVAIDQASALLFSQEAPLKPAAGLHDARAVWAHVPPRPDGGVLVYLHGHNGYVTVDARGRSRVPDWAADDPKAREGAAGKPAAPLVYGLDRLDGQTRGAAPIALAPECSTLATGAFWAKEPAGQYADPARLGLLVADCLRHLARLARPDGAPYIAEASLKARSRAEGVRPDHVYLCGHSGAGLPLEEAARSALILPDTGSPTDLWLFDCTYWSNVSGFVEFCSRWHAARRLGGGRADAARFVCVYRPKTQTEAVADALRVEVAKGLGVDAATLVKEHTPDNFETVVRPALEAAGVLFVSTHEPHDGIPTLLIPALLRTAPARGTR